MGKVSHLFYEPPTWRLIIMSKIKLPKHIVESNFGSVPKEYEAFVYRFTNLDDNKKYVGYHKGYVGDGYWNSSTCDEFKKVYTNSSSRLRYEILNYGTDLEMRQAEFRILSSVDARNNDEYYNMSNGFPVYPEVDLEKCQALVARIENKEFNGGKELLDDLRKIFEKGNIVQVRYEHDAEHQRDIRDKINDALGNTDDCNPIVLYEERASDGSEKGGDGNHTYWGADASIAIDVPVARIPYEVHKEFSDLELETVGHLLNRRAKVIKKEETDKDAMKYLDSVYQSGQPLTSDTTRETLKAYGHSGRKVTSLITKYQEDLKKKLKGLSGQNFINYKAEPAKSELVAKVESERDKDTMAVSISSGSFKADELWDVIAPNIKTDKNGKLLNDKETGKPMLKKKTLKVLLWHPTGTAEEDWESKWSPYVRNRINCLIEKPYGMRVIIEPQPAWTSNSFAK